MSESEADFNEPSTFFNLAAAFSCTCLAALCAGLTMGLLSLDTLKLKIKLMTGSPEEIKAVSQVLPLLKNHHYLLCSLLIANAGANEALPIFLDELLPSYAAILVSVTIVLIFGEIVPTAVFTGPKQLQIAASCATAVMVLQTVTYPIAKPMSMMLDHFMGHNEDNETYTRDEIAAMVRILRSKGAGVMEIGVGGEEVEVNNPILQKLKDIEQRPRASTLETQDQGAAIAATVEGKEEEEQEEEQEQDMEEAPLSSNEVNVITGVLGLAKITIKDVMTPIDDVHMLSSDQEMDEKTIDCISKIGHSRLPVFRSNDRRHVIGVLMVKKLVLVNAVDSVPLSSLKLRDVAVVGANQSLLDVLNMFQTGRAHIALVSDRPVQLWESMESKDHEERLKPPPAGCEPIGVVTIEDILEEMLQSEIYDEADTDNAIDSKTRENGGTLLRELSQNAADKAIAIASDCKVTKAKEASIIRSAMLHPISSKLNTASAASTTNTTITGKQADKYGGGELAPLAVPPSFSRSAFSAPITSGSGFSRANSSKSRPLGLEEHLLQGQGNQLYQSYGGDMDYDLESDMADVNDQPPSLLRSLTAGNNNNSSKNSSKSSKSRKGIGRTNTEEDFAKFKDVFDEMGVPVIAAGADTRKRPASATKLTPAILSKYMKNKYYTISSASDANANADVNEDSQQSRSNSSIGRVRKKGNNNNKRNKSEEVVENRMKHSGSRDPLVASID